MLAMSGRSGGGADLAEFSFKMIVTVVVFTPKLSDGMLLHLAISDTFGYW